MHVVFCKNCFIFYLHYQYCKSNLLGNIADIENLQIITQTKKKTQWEHSGMQCVMITFHRKRYSFSSIFFQVPLYREKYESWENSKCIELTSLVKWPTWLFDGKVTNILLSVLTLFLSSCHAFFNFSTVSCLLHVQFFLL